MTVEGIDIASYQSTDYSTAGLSFVMVKATEGTGYVNPRHAGQVAHGRTHGLVVGHYHFARPGSVSAQVDYFLQHAAPQPGEILCLDWEDPAVTDEWKDAWIRAVQKVAAGWHQVILYCNRDFWLNRDHTGFCGDGLWIADPGIPAGQPRVTHAWTFHQYSEAGGLDHDVANFPSLAALRGWAAGNTTTPQEDTLPTPADVWSYSHGDKPDVHQTLASAEAQARTNGSALTALTTKVDNLTKQVAALKTAQAQPLDYTKLAAALVAQLKGA